jgi:hypothetical protein
MLCIKSLLLPSPIHGMGVFAAEGIPRGAVVWKFDPKGDLVLTESALSNDDLWAYVRHYGFFDAGRSGFVLCGDNAKWMNHSDAPNTAAVFDRSQRQVYDHDIAIRAIRAGEEITCDYRIFHKPAESRRTI